VSCVVCWCMLVVADPNCFGSVWKRATRGMVGRVCHGGVLCLLSIATITIAAVAMCGACVGCNGGGEGLWEASVAKMRGELYVCSMLWICVSVRGVSGVWCDVGICGGDVEGW
jgi:hypothetical protein